MLSEEIEAPENWRWTGQGNNLSFYFPPAPMVLSSEDDYFEKTMLNLFSWMNDNDLKAILYDTTNFPFRIQDENSDREISYNVPLAYSFKIHTSEEFDSLYADYQSFQNEPFTCRCGHIEHDKSSVICHNCLTLFHCGSCRRTRPDGANFDIVTNMIHCGSCGVECECGRFHGGTLNTCSACNTPHQCSNCRMWTTEELDVIDNINLVSAFNRFGDSGLFCSGCRSSYCLGCNEFHESVNQETHLCERCEFLGEDGDNETHDDNSEMAATKLTLPTIPGREMIRLCGVEIEGGYGDRSLDDPSGEDGPNLLARALYDNGLSSSYRQVSYHHGEGFARVETDSSCDWECVIGPINMADLNNVRQFNSVVKHIKSHINEGFLKLDLRCGTHIHVSAEKVSLGQAYNLHLLYTHMEDVMYRLGASHWPVHRILIQGENSHSAIKSPKQTGKVKFARTFHGNRYYGLSFNNYFESMFNNCSCGAVKYGSFEECTCSLGKCTFEFRLFNSTANTIKLHAYLALCQALVAKAISMPEIKDAEAFEEFPFLMKRYKDMQGLTQTEMLGKWGERLRYIANDLPLTDEEKTSILYCINNSELAKVSDSVKALYKGDN